MIRLSEDLETLARRVAALDRTSVEDTIQRALLASELKTNPAARSSALVAAHVRGQSSADWLSLALFKAA